MPVQKSVSPVGSIVKKLSGSFNKHKADETKLGGGNLPGGIRGGIAEFTGGKLDVYKSGTNKDKPYMSLVGVVKAPAAYAGMQTRCRVDLFAKGQGERAKTEDEMVGIALNELRKLGIDTKALSPEDWQDAMDSKAKEGVVFRFETVTAKKSTDPRFKDREPAVYENWNGAIESYVESSEATEAAVVDETEHEPDANQEEPDTTEDGEVDWAAVGEAAEAGDDDAKTQITQAAIDQGIQEEVEGADNWIEAAALLGGGVAEPQAEQVPEKGETVKYKPPKARKAIECEVMAVFEGKKTVNLKDEKGTSYKGIAWGELER